MFGIVRREPAVDVLVVQLPVAVSVGFTQRALE